MLENPAVVALIVVVILLVLRFAVILAASGGDVRRIRLSIRSSWRTLRDPGFADQVQALLELPPPKAEKPPKPSGEPLRLLALLQREGRLLDFLLEDIAPYTDDQVGAAVRKIHDDCRKAVQEHLALEPVLPQPEGEEVEVPAGFDPSAIRLSGNVTGQPPFKGKLQHRGWRVREIKLAQPPEGQDEFVLMPAEVELP
jgi:hypothetical protein